LPASLHRIDADTLARGERQNLHAFQHGPVGAKLQFDDI
jgi:hypothetical protein